MTAATATEPRAPGPKHASARFGSNRAARRCARQGRRRRSGCSRVPAATTDGYNSRPGLLFLNNRYHDPSLGSFISVDPLVVQTGEPYIYGSANPVTLSDPSGLYACPYSYIAELGCYKSPGGNTGVENHEARQRARARQSPPEEVPTVEAALAAFTGDPMFTLIPGAEPRPEGLEGAIWDLKYGPGRADSGILKALGDVADATSPYASYGALVVCIAASGGVCGVATATAATIAVADNAVSCALECDNAGDVVSMLTKSGFEVAAARLPAPNGWMSNGSVARLVAETGGTPVWAREVIRNRRVSVSFVATFGLDQWPDP